MARPQVCIASTAMRSSCVSLPATNYAALVGSGTQVTKLCCLLPDIGCHMSFPLMAKAHPGKSFAYELKTTCSTTLCHELLTTTTRLIQEVICCCDLIQHAPRQWRVCSCSRLDTWSGPELHNSSYIFTKKCRVKAPVNSYSSSPADSRLCAPFWLSRPSSERCIASQHLMSGSSP